MSAPAVAVVDARTPGNIGTIARSMKNFGFSELKLVDPPELDPDGEAYGYAGQAREDILPAAEELSFDALHSSFHTVGFTATTNERPEKHVRYPFSTPSELCADLENVDAQTALVFGRERIGLTNEELGSLDRICSIPANPEYPVLNLGQAATVVFYELQSLTLETSQLPTETIERAPEAEIEGFYEQFDSLLEDIDYRPEKHGKTMRLMRRLLGRADPTGREVTTLRGVVRQASQRIRRAEDTDPE